MKVIFSNRAYTSVLAETAEKIKTETGGLFLGTVIDGTWYIIEAIDPGPKSIFEVAYFEYDQKYTQHLINKVANLYDKQLSLIGLWHRHPGSFDQFSSTDDGTNAKYAAMRAEGAVSALVNIDPTFRITMYKVDSPCRYTQIKYEVGDELIPEELLHYKTPERLFDIMDNMLHPQRRNTRVLLDKNSADLGQFMKRISPHIAKYQCTDDEVQCYETDEAVQELLLDEILDDITFMAEAVGIETGMSMDGNTVLVYQGDNKLYFIYDEDTNDIILICGEYSYLYRSGMFIEAYGKTKTNQERQPEKQRGVFGSAFNRKKPNKKEDQNDED